MPQSEFQGCVAEIERLLLSAEKSQLSQEIREKIRNSLLGAIRARSTAEFRKNISLADHLEIAASDREGMRPIALLMLRLLNEHGVLNDSSPLFQMRVVHLIENGAPDIFRRLDVGKKRQTYEQYAVLETVHSYVVGFLATLAKCPKNPDEFVAARQPIQKAVGDATVNAYLTNYDFAAMRIEIETLLLGVAELHRLEDSSFTQKRADLRERVARCSSYCREHRNFLTVEIFEPFLGAVSGSLDEIDRLSGERFRCDLVPQRKAPYLAEKRYPLAHEGRQISIVVPITNKGPGVALDVNAEIGSDSENVVFDSDLRMGDVTPGDFVVAFDSVVVKPCTEAKLVISLSWGTTASLERRVKLLDVTIQAQAATVNWDALEGREPYSLEVAEGEEFVGRGERVKGIANRYLKDRMTSSYITGQKRVGKTSLARAVEFFIKSSKKGSDYEVLYLEYGAYARFEPIETVSLLGTRLAKSMARHCDSVPVTDNESYMGTLAPLIDIADRLQRECPSKRFVFVLDEFDEMHPKMFQYGALAETFFANLRTLAAKRNVSFLLVGGERMPFIIGSQGDQLNKFVREALDYYSKAEEWSDYVALVESPVRGEIDWTPSAIGTLFDLTNGHPYYTKLVCGHVFSNAVRERDAEITDRDVRRVVGKVARGLDTNAFAHLWKDGIPIGETEQQRVRELQRCRVLVAIARALRGGESITKDVVTKYRHANLQEGEIQPLLEEFVRRDIMRSNAGSYQFKVPLFEAWLKDIGVDTLIWDYLGEEFEAAVNKAEQLAYVKGGEIAELVEQWPAYRGKPITTDVVRAWLEQVSGNQSQRLLFKLLTRLRVVSAQEVREQLRVAHSQMVLPELPEKILTRKSDRRGDVLVTYVDGAGKSGAKFASLYAEENRLASKSVVATKEVAARIGKSSTEYAPVKVLVIIDDFVGTGESLGGNVEMFLREHEEELRQHSVKVVVIALIATREGEEHIRRRLAKIKNVSVDFRTCAPLDQNHVAFGNELGFWSDDDEKSRAKALCLNLGAKIYKEQPLGFGGLGVLVAFADTCPNNSLPILHAGDGRGANWKPLFPRPKN